MAEGFGKIVAAQGTEANPKPSFLWEDTKASATRLFAGTAIGVISSIIIGILMGSYRWIEAPLAPIIMFMAKIPPTAILCLYMIAFGTGINLFIAMVALGIFFTMTQSVFQATRQDVTQEAIHKAYTLGATDMEVIFEIIWPQIMPRILEIFACKLDQPWCSSLRLKFCLLMLDFRISHPHGIAIDRMNIVFWYLAFLGGFGL